MPSLEGRRVALLETRMSEEAATLVRRLGGTPDVVPAVREVVRPEKLVATEKFDDAWYPGEAVNTTVFEQKSGFTKVRLTVLYQSQEARDTATRSGMEQGMIVGFNRLEELLSTIATSA